MGERTGLGVLEAAALRAVGTRSGPNGRFVPSSEVLELLEREGLGSRYLYGVLQDLAVPWRLHLPLLQYQGNLGSSGSDPAADPGYTEVRLSPIGRLAVRAEAGAAGPVPLGLIDGSLYRGGRVPPFEPRLVADTLRLLLAQEDDAFTDAELDALVGGPALPTGGTVEGDVDALLAGDDVPMRMSCRIERRIDDGRSLLQITGFPLGVDVDQMVQCIADRSRFPDERRGGGRRFVADLQARSSGRTGVRIQVLLRHGVDDDEAEQWLRTVWPVTVEADWRLPSPMHELLRASAALIRSDPGGFRELRALL